MVASREGLGVGLLLAQGMTCARDRGELVVIKLEHADVRRRQLHRFDVDGEMAAPLTERLDGLLALTRHPADAHRGSKPLKPPPERLHENEIADLARRHGEVALRVARVEGLCRAEQALHAGEDHMDGGGKLLRLCRRHEPLAGAHEQLVGEDFSKLSKGMADGGGAAPEALCGPRDARIDEQRVEDDEKIGVDFL